MEFRYYDMYKFSNNKSLFLERMNILHSNLTLVYQKGNQRPKGLVCIAKDLVDPKILDYPDENVLLVTSCCVVELLRIFAPETPFGDEETVRAFKVIVTQLRRLLNSEERSSGSQIVYILTTMIKVQSCVIPVMLAKKKVSGAEDLIFSLFDVILSGVGIEHSIERESLSVYSF